VADNKTKRSTKGAEMSLQEMASVIREMPKVEEMMKVY
jgi:hypothetical protein